MFYRVGQNELVMQTHQPQIVDNNGGSARLMPLDPPYVLILTAPSGSMADYKSYSVGGAALAHGYVPKPLRGGSIHPE